jgi:hypothetical protein
MSKNLLNETFKKHLKLLHEHLNINESNYDAQILDNGDYKILAINDKDNPLDVKVGDIVPKGKATLKQYYSDGDYFKVIDENLNENVDINQVASTLQFKPVTKQKLVYKYVENGKPGSMSPMTYTKSTVQQPVVTTTTDGKETQNTAEVGDIIMSGATGENYVVKAAKLPKLYTGNVGSDIYPEQSPRQVALYSGEPVTFKAPWGEDMVIKPGDYLVKDPANTGYYRIAKVEFEKTYNKL